jgi:glycosyltransferase involved in cell wall biosynthesis
LEDQFTFTGRVPYQRVVSYINALDIGVAPFPAARNAVIGLSPLKIYEYLACARPVITSRIDGVKETIEECSGGYLFEPDKATELAQRISQAYGERNQLPEMGKRGRRLIEERYAWTVIAHQVESILKEAVDRRT